MSVASRNPFAILDDGDSRPSSPKAAAPAPPAPPAAPARDNKKPQQKGPRGGQYYARGGARTSGAHAEGNPNQNGVEESESAPRKFEGGRGRGRGGARGGARGGRRPYDKHSATGKTDSDKKVHQGWGGDNGKTELQAETAATVDAAAESGADTNAGTDAWGASTGGDAAGWGATDAPADTSAWDAPAGEATATEDNKPAGEREGRPRREEEEEDNTLTLDQYLAQKKEKEALALPQKPQARQANEGADGDLWKDAVALEKGEDDAYFAGKGKSAPKARAKKEEKVYLEIDGRFERPARGGRGRGDGRGRGEGRGRGARGVGGRGGPRGGAGRQNGASQPTVNVDDQAAFPSLS